MERLLARFAAVSVGVSLGTARSGRGSSFDDLLTAADARMHAVKQARRAAREGGPTGTDRGEPPGPENRVAAAGTLPDARR